MEISKYQVEAARTNATIEPGYAMLENLHMVMGMTTEVGELMDVFKKNLAYKKPIDWVNAKEEIGDLMWYIVNFCNINGFDIREIMQTNIDKLQARFPDKFSTEKANVRDLSIERTILEGQINEAKSIADELIP